jgi:uncharacterized repeat protein (TIGR01451 family)
MVPAWKERGGRLFALCMALLLLIIPETAAPLTPSGTVISHSFTARFATPLQSVSITSAPSQVTIKDLSDPAIIPPRTAVTPAGQSIDFLHTVTNRGNSSDSFQLKAELVQGALPDRDVTPRMLFYSSDGKTLLPTDTGRVQLVGPIAPGASVDVVLRATPPAGSEGCVDTIAVTASSVLTPARNSVVRDQMVVPAALAISTPVKSVSPAGSVLPGTVLSYGIALANPGATAITGVRLSDTLSGLLEYQNGTATFPAGVTGTASYDTLSRTLNFAIPTLPAGFSGSLTFQARVRSDAPGASTIQNTASLTSDLSSTPAPSNTTVNTVLAPALRISKVAGTAAAEIGDIVSYSVLVENVGSAALSHVTVTDKLPRGFRYLKGSSVVNGSVISDPVGGGERLSWDLGSLGTGASLQLSYRCAISADAQAGLSTNSAAATGGTPSGGAVLSPEAHASIRIRSSVLGDKAIILGRLFEDLNGNGVPDPGEPGLAGIRVYLEDGSFVFSDKEGQYSFTGISPGNHVVKIDRATLPAGYLAVPYNTAFAGVGWSQFITVPFGGPARGDFAFTRKPGAPPGPQPSLSGAPGAGTGVNLKELAPNPPEKETAAPAPLSPSTTVPGPAGRLRVTPERLDMPADGKTVVPFTVELLNANGKRVAGSRSVTVSLAKGGIVEPDQDPALPGHQILVQDGIGVFRVRSTKATGQDQILVRGENGTKGKVDLFFSQELRDWILVGLGSLTVGNRAVSGHMEKLDKEERFDEGIFHDERLAFFTRGKILGKYLLTAAYDSQKERREGVFQTIDPEKYYPVYGDASDIGYEAASRGKIYLKIESARSYLMAGDYRTDLSENEFSRYDRALNGVKFEVNTEHLDVKGFESRTEETQVKDEIPGNGTSGYYILSHKPLFENSERIRIEVRDRYHSERLITVSEKVRYGDYTIDYNSGAILFKEPVPSLDQNLNPVTIVVNYQSPGASERYVYGGRALAKSSTGSYIGGTAVVEQREGKDTTLYGVDAGLKLGERVSLKGEGAVSDTLEKGRGAAYKAELSANPFDSLNLGAYYRKVESDFSNESMTGNEFGTEKYGGRLDYRGLWDTLFFGESFVQKNELTGLKQFGNQAGFVRKFSLYEGEGGFKRIEEEKSGSDGHSDLLYAGIKGPVTPKLDASLRRDQLLSPSNVAEYQSRTFLKLDYRLSEKTTVFLTEEYQEGSPLIRQATRFGVETRLNERMRIATGYQLSSGAAGNSEQRSVDLKSKLFDQDGFSLDSRTSYQLENALSEQRGQAVLGLNSRFRVAEGLNLNSTLERVQTVQGHTGTRTAFTLAGEYLRQKEMKLTGRYEIRDGAGERSSLYGAGIAYKLTPEYTLLGKATYWDNDLVAGHDRILDSYLGTSFRPLQGNPWQLLTLLRYKLEEKGSVPGSGESRSFIVSTEPTYRIVKDWSAQGKYAGKLNWSDGAGGTFRTYTDLILAGVSYDLTERWELALYLKLANQYDTGQHSLGSVASAGYRVYRNVVLSAGYNYARLDDRDLTGETFQGQGPFVGVKVKFDEDMFERSEVKTVELPAPPAKPPVAAEMPPPAQPPVKPKPIPALLVASTRIDEPLRLSGSAELLTLLINGEKARLPSTAVTVRRERVDSLDLKKGKVAGSLRFLTSVESPEEVRSWSLNILNGDGEIVRILKGSGAPQRRIAWDDRGGGGSIKEGEIYQYELQVTYLDGSTFNTGRDLFGVNRRQAVLLTVAGGAFIFDSSELTPEAKLLLKQAARLIRSHPQEQVIVEGHTDGVGTVLYNIGLSQRRCDSAADYLVSEEGIAPSRLIRRWYGKSRPIADNVTTEGRRMNRRVELKGDFQDTVKVGPNDRYRSKPFVIINDREIPVDPLGRFETSLPADTGMVNVEMGDSLGRSLATAIPVPGITVIQPALQTVVQYGGSAGGITLRDNGIGYCMLSGAIEEGSSLDVDGKAVTPGKGGKFAVELPLQGGAQVYGMVLRNQAGCSRLMNLRLQSTRQMTSGVAQ